MPKLSVQTKKIRDLKFLNALKETKGNAKEAAIIVGKIGSQGATDLDNSAKSSGSQRLSNLNPTMLDALAENGVTPDKIAKKIDRLLDKDDYQAIDKVITK